MYNTINIVKIRLKTNYTLSVSICVFSCRGAFRASRASRVLVHALVGPGKSLVRPDKNSVGFSWLSQNNSLIQKVI